MKTKLIILALVFTSICKSQVSPIVEIEGGYLNRMNSIYLPDGMTLADNAKIGDKLYKFPIFTNVTLGAKWKFLTLTTYTMNMFKSSGVIDFEPGQIDFTTNLNANYKHFEIGYEHSCSHPIISDPKIINVTYRASYDKIYLKIKIL